MQWLNHFGCSTIHHQFQGSEPSVQGARSAFRANVPPATRQRRCAWCAVDWSGPVKIRRRHLTDTKPLMIQAIDVGYHTCTYPDMDHYVNFRARDRWHADITRWMQDLR